MFYKIVAPKMNDKVWLLLDAVAPYVFGVEEVTLDTAWLYYRGEASVKDLAVNKMQAWVTDNNATMSTPALRDEE